MKYYLDTEFIEGFRKPIQFLPTIKKFNKPYHFIDLVSIGIVSENGNEYYAICNEFDEKYADKWVKENVLNPIYSELYQKQTPYEKTHFSFGTKTLLKRYGKSKKQIAQDIFEFCTKDTLTLEKAKYYNVDYSYQDIQFYAYYADYDWVLFCTLFGRMIDLPKGFPMYCRDLKQMLDDKLESSKIWSHGTDLNFKINAIKNDEDFSKYCPKQENEHNALDDAKWNHKLHNFISKWL